MSRIVWPPQSETIHVIGGVQQNRDGTPTWLYLRRWPHDRTLTTHLFNQCCDCGLEHLYTYNVVREKSGRWWLVKRAYRVGKKYSRKRKKQR